MIGQAIIVTVSAVTAFFMVALNKQIGFGKYDARLLIFAIGIPCAICGTQIGLDWLGPSGFWYYNLLFLYYAYNAYNMNNLKFAMIPFVPGKKFLLCG